MKFFNQPYLRSVYKVHTRLIIYGQVKQDPFTRGSLGFMNPECEILEEEQSRQSVHSGRVVPIYRRLGELRTRTLRQIMDSIISHLPSDIPDAIPANSAENSGCFQTKGGSTAPFSQTPGIDSGGAPEGTGSSQCGDFSGAQTAHFRRAFPAPGGDCYRAPEPCAACKRPQVPFG